jgi:hypothetical protein
MSHPSFASEQNMPAVSPCPKCGQYVTISDDVASAAQVRCPHCAVEFPLQEVSGDPPPALIPVVPTGEEVASLNVGETDDEAADLVTDEEIPALESAGDRSDEGYWGEAAADHEPVGGEAVGEGLSTYGVRPPDGEPIDEDADRSGEPGIAPVYAEAFDFVPRDLAEGDSAAAVAARLRQDAGRHSMFGELVKVILGGFVGLAIGYYLLNFLGGERFDRLGIYLPGCPHTYHHWPADEGDASGNGDKSNY